MAKRFPAHALMVSDPVMRTKPGRSRCFTAATPGEPLAVRCELADEAARALSTLLPILGCGEEAAGLAFAGLAATHTSDPMAAGALHRIAEEEQVHDRLIHSLSAALPPPPPQAELRSRIRRFHIELGRGDRVTRLARIAALDSAVCLLLPRLLRPGTPLSAEASVSAILRRIARDEANHVRVTRALAMARAGERELRHIGMPVREHLGALLTEVADAFEALAFDPRWLRDGVGQLPDGLFRA